MTKISSTRQPSVRIKANGFTVRSHNTDDVLSHKYRLGVPPGMEQGKRKDAYDVLLVKQDGNTQIYAQY